jgi:predicted Zn-ribbon and HTH transcriptional regulator
MFILFFCLGEMMYLLVTCRWRIHIRKALSPDKKTEPATTAEVENEHVVDEDDKLLNEMEELSNAMERKKKREKKILAKRRAKVCGWIQHECIFRSLQHHCYYIFFGNNNRLI